MNIENWHCYYKIHETEGRPTTTQMCYEPRINPEGNVFCMNFCFPCEYQSKQPRISYTKDLVDLMFYRELYYLNLFKDFNWAPEILEITDNKIFIKWYDNTCNDLLYKHNSLESLHPGWFDDLKNIILDQVNFGYLKPTLYPHSHYYDKHGTMRTIDFYAVVEKTNPYMEKQDIEGLVGTDTDRFQLAQEGKMFNIETIFKSALTHYGKWPRNLNEVFEEIYEK